MTKSIQERNKKLVLEAFDTLFNKTRLRGGRTVLVAAVHSAQRAHRTRQGRAVRLGQNHATHAALRTWIDTRGG
jgi:hypothetical protein